MNWVLYIVSSRFNKKAASVSEGRFAFSNLIYGCGVAGGGVGGVGLGLTGIYNLAAESIWFSHLFEIPQPSKRHKQPLAFSVASHRATCATCPCPFESDIWPSVFRRAPLILPFYPASHVSRLLPASQKSEQTEFEPSATLRG
jgi:hypothetical protein